MFDEIDFSFLKLIGWLIHSQEVLALLTHNVQQQIALKIVAEIVMSVKRSLKHADCEYNNHNFPPLTDFDKFVYYK